MNVSGYRVISNSCPFLLHCVFFSIKLKRVDSGTNRKRDHEECSKQPQPWWLHVQKIFLMLITFKSLPLSDSHASDWKFSQISSSTQVREELHCPQHKVDGTAFRLDRLHLGTVPETLKQARKKKNITSPQFLSRNLEKIHEIWARSWRCLFDE